MHSEIRNAWMRIGFAHLLCGAALAVMSAQPSAAKTYRWVDQQGQVHYSDHLPAKHTQTDIEVVDEHGVVSILGTPSEDAADETIRQAAEAQSKEAQRRQDEQLLSRYANTDEIVARRNEQLAVLDARLAIAERALAQSQDALSTMRERIEQTLRAGQTVSAQAQNQLLEHETVVRSSQAALDAMRAERNKLEAEFERDLQRFSELNS
ncbi:MAG: DUF4124 domain-containing protein [Oceanococcus sp.]|nr:MAG: DUF4124 domain-containing protein [Oceanococcus sp.]